MVNDRNLGLIQTKLNKRQYIEFLEFCEKKEISKFECVKLAVEQYCKIKSKRGSNKSTSYDLEINELKRKTNITLAREGVNKQK